MRKFLGALYSTAMVAATAAACNSVDSQPAAPQSTDDGANATTAGTDGGVPTAGNVSAGATGTVGGSAVNGAISAASTVSGTGAGGTGNAGAEPDEDTNLAAAGAAGAGGSTGDPVTEEPAEVFATNPFVVARHDPLSTFAADVDTASYDTFRSYALSNVVPEPSRIRLEDFVNYFD